MTEKCSIESSRPKPWKSSLARVIVTRRVLQSRLSLMLLLFIGVSSPSIVAGSSATCSTLSSFDCNGEDLHKIDGTSAAPMSASRCCDLCFANTSCTIAVVATAYKGGIGQCLLKSGCGTSVAMKDRIRVCYGGDPRCNAPSPTPPPGPVHTRCDLVPGFCDVAATPSVRAAALVSKLTTEEKVGCVGSNGAIALPRFGIPHFQWWGEALHGVCKSPAVSFRPPTPTGTSFPEIIGVASSFDSELFAAMGAAIGLEARVMMNAGNAGGTFWAPNINIVKDPRWGRLQETPGEDPTLSAEYAALFVSNFQNTTTAPRHAAASSTYLQASSCCKHFAAYSEENWNGLDRFHFDSNVTVQAWEETYLPAFQACIVHGRASGVMCSYNSINGVPTCADPHLLTTIARGQLGFDGYITGDCGAAKDVYATHNFTATAKEAADASLAAGMDQDCGSFLKDNLGTNVNESAINRAVTNLFAIRIRLGLFDNSTFDPFGYKALTSASINATKHIELARRAATEGIVLLHLAAPKMTTTKKRGSPLASYAFPLDQKALGTIAVIGPNADNAANMQGVDCHGVAPFLITPRDALNARIGDENVLFAQGCGITSNATAAQRSAAIAAAMKSDATLLVLGLDASVEYEMRDRTTLYLPAAQRALAAAVIDAAASKSPPAPVVIALFSGGVIDVSEFITDSRVAAVVWCGYPGQSGGDALADIVLGKAAPSGRVSLTWYTEAYLYNGHPGPFPDGPSDPNAMSMWDMRLRPNASSTVKLGRTYRFFSYVRVLLTSTTVNEYLLTPSFPHRFHASFFSIQWKRHHPALSFWIWPIAACVFVLQLPALFKHYFFRHN